MIPNKIGFVNRLLRYMTMLRTFQMPLVSVVKVHTLLGGDIISCRVGRMLVHSGYMSVLLVDSQ